jgi:hypothetical protein
VGGALRQYNDGKVAKEKATQEATLEANRQKEQKERDAAADRLAEMRHRETAAMIAARSELATVREQLAAKSGGDSATKASVASSGEKIAALDDAITQASRDVSGEMAAELRRQADQLKWFEEGRREAAEWNKALRPHVDRILRLITEGAHDASAKGLAVLVSETPDNLPHGAVYLPFDGPLEGLDQNREMIVKEFQFQKFKWVVKFAPGRVEISPAKEVRPHEMVSPIISINSMGMDVFVIGFGNRDTGNPAPMLVRLTDLPRSSTERLTKVQEDYQKHNASGDKLISETLAEAFKMCIVRADTSR